MKLIGAILLCALVAFTTAATRSFGPPSYSSPRSYTSQRSYSSSRSSAALTPQSSYASSRSSLSPGSYGIPPRDIQVVRLERTYPRPHNYQYSYELSDGTLIGQNGEFRNPGSQDEVFVVQGYYSRLLSNDRRQNVVYTADENGYRPEISEGGPGDYPPHVYQTALG